MIWTNEYFEQDLSYFYVYLILVLFLAAASILFLIYAICKDSKGTRALLPWTFLIAFVISFLITLWIVIYITCIYRNQEVTVQNMNMSDEDSSDESQRKRYVK